jgi:hypothetical protein
MGLLEYQTMPSLRDVAHDRVLCTFSNRSAPDRGASGVVRHTTQSHNLLGYSPPANLDGRRDGPAL